MDCSVKQSQQLFINKFFGKELVSEVAVINKKSLNSIFKEKVIKENSFITLDLKSITYQKLTSYFEKGRIVLLSFDDERNIKKIHLTHNSPIKPCSAPVKDSRFELLDEMEYLEFFGYCLEELGSKAIDLPEPVVLSKEEKKIFNLFINKFQNRKIDKTNKLIFQMLMKYNETVSHIIKNIFKVDEEEKANRKKVEERREIIRAHILYEIRQKALNEDEIKKNEILQKELQTV